MKKIIFLSLSILLIIGSCTQKAKVDENARKIENTLVSISFWKDTLGLAPSECLSSLEKINKAIDSIGYPDAGYKLWLIQGDTNKDKRFMMEGYWPDQAIYDTIHSNSLYKNAIKDVLLGKLKMVEYYRYTIVK
jgi:hypothetical protein